MKLSDSPEVVSHNPAIAVDSEERIHVVWAEALAGEVGASAIFYRSCHEGECTDPAILSNPAVEVCGSETNLNPSIAINGANINSTNLVLNMSGRSEESE